ncbi:MAG TPA: hypothetical protein VJL58_01950 [Pyrinomonadaceae bacterium]|nr:hypothetical protein [Pyrinomonadaceae bacterium]
MKLFIFLIFALFFTLLLGLSGNAQQTIFNVPTSDVLDKGKVYAELDAAFKVDRGEHFGRFSSVVPRVVVGISRKLEVGLNVIGNIQPGKDSTTLVPTVKWKFYENETKDLALFGGTHVYIPVRNRLYGVGTYSYLAASKTIRKTRLTAGGFVASKSVFAPLAVRAGGQFGLEHSLTDRVTLAADWITGRHANGYFTPGIIYKPHPKVTTYWSYSLGNDRSAEGNHFFLFEYGYSF